MMEWIIVILAVALVLSLLFSFRLWRLLTVACRQERMKITFLRNINHEIRVPLKSFRTMAATMAKDDLYLSKSEKRNMSEQLSYNANLIGTLLDEVMMFTEAEDAGHVLSVDSFSPNELCRRCLRLCPRRCSTWQ